MAMTRRPLVGYHHILMAFLTIPMVLTSILIAGCTSENMKGIYLLSLSYALASPPPAAERNATDASSTFSSLAANSTRLEIRAGYLGMCARAADEWACSRSPDVLRAFVRRAASGGEVGDPLDLIRAADTFRSEIVFVALLFTSVAISPIAIVLMSTFKHWGQQVDLDGDNSDAGQWSYSWKAVLYTTFACVVISPTLTLIAGFWQHLSSSTASTMVQTFTYGAVHGHAGSGAMILVWLSVLLLVLALGGVITMMVSIKILQQLLEQEVTGSDSD